MTDEILSVAVLEALPGKETELLATLRELYTMMKAKGYCRDALHRDSARPGRFVHLRYWTSPRCVPKPRPIPKSIATGCASPSCAPSSSSMRAWKASSRAMTFLRSRRIFAVRHSLFALRSSLFAFRQEVVSYRTGFRVNVDPVRVEQAFRPALKPPKGTGFSR